MSLEATTTETTTATAAPAVGSTPSSEVAPAAAPQESVEVATPTEEVKPLDKMASRFAALTRKEKELQKKAQEYKAREEKLSELAKIEELLQKDPLSLLQKYGHSYESLTEFVLTEGKMTPEKRLEKLEKSLEEERIAKKKAEEEAKAQEAKQTEEQAIKVYQGQCQAVLDTNPDAYEFTRLEEDALSLMYQVAEEHWNKTQKLLSPKEAADLVEAYYEERADKLASTKKLRSKLSLLEPTAPATESPKISHGHEAIASKEKRPTTLTNAQQAQSVAPKKDPSEMTREEALEYAASLLRWE